MEDVFVERSVRFPKEIYETTKDYAHYMGISVTAVVNMALRTFLDANCHQMTIDECISCEDE